MKEFHCISEPCTITDCTVYTVQCQCRTCYRPLELVKCRKSVIRWFDDILPPHKLFKVVIAVREVTIKSIEAEKEKKKKEREAKLNEEKEKKKKEREAKDEEETESEDEEPMKCEEDDDSKFHYFPSWLF